MKEVLGGKVEYSTVSGSGLASLSMQNGCRYLTVLLGSHKGKSENDVLYCFEDTSKLVDWITEDFSIQKVVEFSTPLSEIPINYSKEVDVVKLYPKSEILFVGANSCPNR